VLEWPDDGAVPAAILAQSSPTGVAATTSAPVATMTSGVTPAAVAASVATRPTVAAMQAGTQPSANALPPSPSPASPLPAAVPSPVHAPVKTMQDVVRRAGMRPLIIAIDAGHGGQDPGARGPGGTREKMVTLAVAKELARQVNATPGLKAYLTRDTDVFIPLVQRYQKARAAKADLFVSIHADSFTSPSASGSSVFVLSQRGASSQAARWLASQENAADLVGGVKLQDKDDTLASVLLDLSQSATLKASEDMAEQVLGGLKQIGRTHKGEVERANFVVLRSPDVPSMLVETAFISNPDEERRLNDPAHQAQLARAILNGVTSYFSRQPPPGTLYAARADAGGNAGLPGGGSR
jgi:N-acetylmuramoyl-L-alanine amidase